MIVNEAQLIKQAQALAREVKWPAVIYLQGELGAGKTTFCRAFIQALGHDGAVKSPTYTLLEPYDLDDLQIIHCDLYRLANGEELELLGFRDYLTDNSIVLIEWPEKASGYLPTPDITIQLNHHPEGRELKINAQN